MKPVIFVLAYLILAPFVGALLDRIDRIVSARMQRRKGPSLMQPFYDLGKLFSKEMIAVNNVQLLLNLSYLVILMIAGSMLFAGADLLMVLFILSTADMFLIMAASSDSSAGTPTKATVPEQESSTPAAERPAAAPTSAVMCAL